MQLHLLSALLFGISSNTDNLVVGLSYGIKKMPILWLANLIVAAITFTGTILSMVLGKSACLFLSEDLGGSLGSIIIILIGLVGLIRFFVKKNSEEAEEQELLALTVKEAILVGLALTANNVGLGIGAGITGLKVLPTALCSFLFSLTFLYLGNRIGRSRLSDMIGRFAEPLAGLLMIGLGVYEIFI